MKFFIQKKIYIPLGILVLLGVGLACFWFLAPEQFSDFYEERLEPYITETENQIKFKPADYFVSQTVDIKNAQGGFSGQLRLLQDKKLAGVKNTKSMDDPLENIIKDCKSAVLQLVSNDGKVVDKIFLDQVYATVDGQIDLYGDGRPVYKIIEDANIGMGSHSGFVTSFLEIIHGRLVLWGHFLASLKEGWKLVPAKNGRGKDILQVDCWPTGEVDKEANDGSLVFEITYRRYSFDGHSWVIKENTTKGMWENEDNTPDGFPEESKFP